MPFTSGTLLEARININHLSEIHGGTNSLLLAISECDKIITAYTGVEPKDEPSENNAMLTSLAGDIVIWILTGRQTGIDEQIRMMREKKYDDAIKTLEQIRDGLIKIAKPEAEQKVKPDFASVQRMVRDGESYY